MKTIGLPRLIDCDPDRLASMISLCYSALTTRIALFLMR